MIVSAHPTESVLIDWLTVVALAISVGFLGKKAWHSKNWVVGSALISRIVLLGMMTYHGLASTPDCGLEVGVLILAVAEATNHVGQWLAHRRPRATGNHPGSDNGAGQPVRLTQ